MMLVRRATPVLHVRLQRREEDGLATISVTRTGGSTGSVGVSYNTSRTGQRLLARTTRRPPAPSRGQTANTATKTFNILITNDTDGEIAETINLALSAPTGGATLGFPSSAVLTIVDDDIVFYAPAALSFTTPPSDGIVNVALPGQPVVAIVDTSGVIDTSDNTTPVRLSLVVPAEANSPTAAEIPAFSPGTALQHADGPLLPVFDSGQYSSFSLGAPDALGTLAAGVQTANFVIIWDGPWPQDAKDAFDYAARIWGATITSSVDIQVKAKWGATGHPGALAVGGPQYTSSAANPNRWFVTSLLNIPAGVDLDSDFPDIEVTVEPNVPNFYYKTDGQPGAAQIDFVTVILHELGHGLGLLSSARATGSLGGWKLVNDTTGQPMPSTWDTSSSTAPVNRCSISLRFRTSRRRFTDSSRATPLPSTALRRVPQMAANQ